MMVFITDTVFITICSKHSSPQSEILQQKRTQWFNILLLSHERGVAPPRYIKEKCI